MALSCFPGLVQCPGILSTCLVSGACMHLCWVKIMVCMSFIFVKLFHCLYYLLFVQLMDFPTSEILPGILTDLLSD